MSGEYISREAARSEVLKWADGYSYIEMPTENAIAQINAIPAADVVEVVRCRDCKNYRPWGKVYERKDYTGLCMVWSNMSVHKEDYCSHAVRKSKEGEERKMENEYIIRDEAMNLPVLPKEQRIQPLGIDEAFEEGWRQALENLAILPAADVVEVRHGRWEISNWGFDYHRCTACGFEHRYEWPYPYCPRCGAKMEADNG